MRLKAIEIRDDMTAVQVLAGRVSADAPAGEVVLWRAGYGQTPADHRSYVLVIRLSGGADGAHTDPFRWDDWTMKAAHLALRDLDLIDTLDDGDTFNVAAFRHAISEGRPLREQIEPAVNPDAHDHDDPPTCYRCGDDGAGVSRFEPGRVLCAACLLAEGERAVAESDGER